MVFKMTLNVIKEFCNLKIKNYFDAIKSTRYITINHIRDFRGNYEFVICNCRTNGQFP